MVEFVPQSYNLASVLEKYGPDNQIHNFFKEKHSDSSAPYGISADVINTFVRSCGNFLGIFLTFFYIFSIFIILLIFYFYFIIFLFFIIVYCYVYNFTICFFYLFYEYNFYVEVFLYYF